MDIDVSAVKDRKAGWQIKVLVGNQYEWCTPKEARILRDRLTRVLAATRKEQAK